MSPRIVVQPANTMVPTEFAGHNALETVHGNVKRDMRWDRAERIPYRTSTWRLGRRTMRASAQTDLGSFMLTADFVHETTVFHFHNTEGQGSL
jgi:hypothetical protein